MLLRFVVLAVGFACWTPLFQSAPQRAGDTTARKFDEYVLEGEQRWSRLTPFVKQLKREPRRLGYIIVYAERKIVGSGVYYDGEDWKNWVFHNLTAQGLSRDRFVTVNGGLRDQDMIELWLVTPGGPTPVPTPTATETIVCPSVTVLGNVWVRSRKQPVTFRTNLSAWQVYSFPNVVYNWTVSSGKILSGQGTNTIRVDVSQSAENRISARVEIFGLSGECDKEATTTTVVEVAPYKFYDFGKINFGDLKARLDHVALYLQNDPELRLHIITYGGRNGRRGEAKMWSAWMKDFLIQTRGIEAVRIITIDGGFREERSGELWLVPPDVTAPEATPTVDPKDAQKLPRRLRSRGF
jgi:hypothetical protein